MKTKKILYLKILDFNRSIKKRMYNKKKIELLKSMFIYAFNIAWVSFSTNCIYSGDLPAASLLSYGTPGCFEISLSVLLSLCLSSAS